VPVWWGLVWAGGSACPTPTSVATKMSDSLSAGSSAPQKPVLTKPVNFSRPFAISTASPANAGPGPFAISNATLPFSQIFLAKSTGQFSLITRSAWRRRPENSRASAATKANNLNVTICPEPVDGAFECAVHQAGVESQFTLRLLGRNEHFHFGHLYRIQRRARVLAG